MAGSRYENIAGQKFGMLTAAEPQYVSRGGQMYWLCLCDCGNSKTVRASHLKRGNVRSCGCMRASKIDKRLYTIYNGMKQRCNNPNSPSYPYYGGRGIKICDKWLKSFEVFSEWAIHNGYSKDLTLDRINNDGNYEPQNCRWATRLEQANNTRKCKKITCNGETHSENEWSRILGISQTTISSRLRKGSSAEEVLRRR